VRRQSRAESLAGIRRANVLARSLDALLTAAGCIRVRSVWQPRGRITMRQICKSDLPTAEAMARESARRRFLRADDLDAEIARFRLDIVGTHIDALVERLTPDPMRQEATKLALVRAIDELAGEAPSPLVKMLAAGVVLLDAESHAASRSHLCAVGRGYPASDSLKWRDSADRRLHAKIRTLSHIRQLEESALRGSLNKLRLVAG
jgi:hypothetical protein